MRRSVWNKRPVSVLFRTRTYIVLNRYSVCTVIHDAITDECIFLAVMLFRFRLAPRTKLEMDAWLTLRPKNGVPRGRIGPLMRTSRHGCVYYFPVYAGHTRLIFFATEPYPYRDQPLRELKLHDLLMTSKTLA
jgi:hypothetical protein